MRSKRKDLMDKILDYVEEFSFENRRSPSCAEIGQAVGLAKSSVYRYLTSMDEMGLLRYDSTGARSINSQKSKSGLTKAPLIGSVSCGEPILEEENIQYYLPLPTQLFGTGELYLLRANGDSMIEAGIDDGDLVVVRRQEKAEEGKIVVALVGNENTLKRIYYDRKTGETILHPENKAMQDIRVKECMIQGVAVHVIKAL